MAITRIFRVEVCADLVEEFEEKFTTVSVHVAESAAGNRSVTILKPTKWVPNEYCMITSWDDEASVEAFVGTDWNRALIPAGMEEYVENCSVHHYQSWNL